MTACTVIDRAALPLSLACDGGGGQVPFLLLCRDRQRALVSTSVRAVLEHPLAAGSLQLDVQALTDFLEYGQVRLPGTVYRHVFEIGIGHRADLSWANARIQVRWSYRFPYRFRGTGVEDGERRLLERLTAAVAKERQSGCLFLSGGKDSCSLALALAKAGRQSDIQAVTYTSHLGTDEAGFAEGVAKQLGFRHQRLKLPDTVGPREWATITSCSAAAPLPSSDNASLLYPLLESFLPAGLWYDGGGNDVYFGVPPHLNERREARRCMRRLMRPVAERLVTAGCRSERTRRWARTSAQLCGMNGWSRSDLARLLPWQVAPRGAWADDASVTPRVPYWLFKTRVTGEIAATIHLRKLYTYCESRADVALALPWTDPGLADLVQSFARDELLDLPRSRNKLPLRRILRDALDLDADRIGKLAFGFDYSALMHKPAMWRHVREEILDCRLWTGHRRRLVERRLDDWHAHPGPANGTHGKRIHMLFQLALWLNHNRYARDIDGSP